MSCAEDPVGRAEPGPGGAYDEEYWLAWVRAARLRRLRDMSPTEVAELPEAARLERRARVNTWYAMLDRAEVDALPVAEQRRRVAELRADDTTAWGLRQLALYAGVDYETAVGWRNEFLTSGGVVSRTAPPAPDHPETGARVRRPGETDRPRGGSDAPVEDLQPKWKLRTLLWWANGFGRAWQDYTARRGVRLPVSGRPAQRRRTPRQRPRPRA